MLPFVLKMIIKAQRPPQCNVIGENYVIIAKAFSNIPINNKAIHSIGKRNDKLPFLDVTP